MNKIKFWNGNKSPSRQAFESELFKIALTHSSSFFSEIEIDNTDYPSADDESNIFNKGADALVTVAGNPKFVDIDFLEIIKPICKGLLGARIMIVRKEDTKLFSKINKTSIASLKHGIPATWADANLFRANNFNVYEHGSLETIFTHLSTGDCDYIALGANEVSDIFHNFCPSHLSLVIEKSALLYYPMPLVFYVNPNNPKLAHALEEGLEICFNNGQFEDLFDKHYGETLATAKLQNRTIIPLNNPQLNDSIPYFSDNKLTF